jgi:CspA family cold shock protein
MASRRRTIFPRTFQKLPQKSTSLDLGPNTCAKRLDVHHSERNFVNKGTVKWFNNQKGFGFIQPENGAQDVFVHVSAVERAGLPTLSEGQRVNFQTLPDSKGKGPKAVNLKLAE